MIAHMHPICCLDCDAALEVVFANGARDLVCPNGHDVRPTMDYAHLALRDPAAPSSPADTSASGDSRIHGRTAASRRGGAR